MGERSNRGKLRLSAIPAELTRQLGPEGTAAVLLVRMLSEALAEESHGRAPTHLPLLIAMLRVVSRSEPELLHQPERTLEALDPAALDGLERAKLRAIEGAGLPPPEDGQASEVLASWLCQAVRLDTASQWVN